jgi:hypothetical protein
LSEKRWLIGLCLRGRLVSNGNSFRIMKK